MYITSDKCVQNQRQHEKHLDCFEFSLLRHCVKCNRLLIIDGKNE